MSGTCPAGEAVEILSATVESDPIQEGELFATFQDFKARIHGWAAVAGFIIRFARSDRKKNIVICTGRMLWYCSEQ
jgi:hypothetical protein